MPFQKGQSGNPSGRAKKTPELLEIEELAKSHGPDAIAALARWAKQRKNAPAAVAACNALLDRGHGKPRQPIEATITDERMVARMPEKSPDADDWVGKHGPH